MDSQIENTPPNNPKDVNSAPIGIPIKRIVGLYLQGVTKADIARQLQCSPANITTRLQGYEADVEALPDFKKNKADLLAMYQRKILSTLTEDDIKEQSAYQRVGMFGILYDKERLERDLSTENISHDVLLTDLEGKRAAYETAMKARLEGTQGKA